MITHQTASTCAHTTCTNHTFKPHIHTNTNTMLLFTSLIFSALVVRENWFISTCSARVQPGMVGKLWQQDLVSSNHIISAVRKKRSTISAQIAFFPLSQSRTQQLDWHCLQLRLAFACGCMFLLFCSLGALPLSSQINHT